MLEELNECLLLIDSQGERERERERERVCVCDLSLNQTVMLDTLTHTLNEATDGTWREADRERN